MKLDNAYITNLDKSGMMKILIDFHLQIRYSISKISTYPKINEVPKINKIVLFGMGGSAISGDLVRSYISVVHPEIDLPITIIRNYNPPNWLDSSTLAIAISYSGNTEETLSCFTQAMKKTNHLIGIASGGELQKVCEATGIPFINIPGGYQPRAALGYLFFTVLNVLLINFCKICEVSKSMIEFQILADYLQEKGKQYALVNDENRSLQIAKSICNKIAVVYSSSDVLDIVNFRWRGQLQENSKNLAFGNFLPEMNHNEINSYQHPKDTLEKIALIFLSDKFDNPKIIDRLNATKKLLEGRCAIIEHIESQEDMFLVRLFDIIYLADWVSFYLALFNNEDPTPIPLISELKKIMSGN